MTINVSNRMKAVGVDAAHCRNHAITTRLVEAIYTAMEQARLDEDKAMRAEATAARAKETRAWWSQAGRPG